MSSYKNVLLLIGSPKGPSSSSESLGTYLTERLEENGLIVEKAYTHRLMNKEEMQIKLISLIDKADLIVLSFPLYVDSLPSPVIRSMEYISKNWVNEGKDSSIKKGFIAICNCGFPESDQINTAIKICEIFTQDTGFQWLGGLRIGAGGAISGKKLEDRGTLVKTIIDGFNLAAKDIISRNKISQEALDLTSKSFMPKKIYKFVGNLGWRLQALKYRNFRLKKRPYAKK
ncbi:MAG: NAD(P)H-dependent oxidoreductase [Candidatus Lokiarchaeota archaeon]